MEGISDIKITGIDTQRPPRILKQPYINLYFKLSHQAPKRWCEDFTRLTAKAEYTVKIDSNKGLFIETWVRTTAQVEPAFEYLKAIIKDCNQAFIDRIEAEAAAQLVKGDVSNEVGPQGELNKVIAGLNFDD